MSTTKSEKVLGYVKAAPVMMLVFGQMLKILIGIKMKIRGSKKHFKRGVIQAGISKREAEIITRECFNGGD